MVESRSFFFLLDLFRQAGEFGDLLLEFTGLLIEQVEFVRGGFMTASGHGRRVSG